MRTTEANLTTRSQHGLQHLANFNITQNRAYAATHTVLDDGHDSQKNDFVAGRIARFKFAVRHCTTEFYESRIKGYRVWGDEAADEEGVKRRECSGGDGTCG